MSTIEMTRRDLLKTLGGGILVLAFGPSLLGQRGNPQGQTTQTISAWLHIGPDGQITVMTGKVEVGQNARTMLTQGVAEELRVPVESIKMVMGDTDLVPFDAGTFGSRTTPQMVPQLRRAAAAARETMLDMAAEKLKVDKAALKLENGRVVSGSQSLSFGDLAKEQPFDKQIGDVTLTPIGDWKVLGKTTIKVGARDIVTGKHEFTADLTRPGMLHAKVLRPPTLGATLKSVDTSGAAAIKDVRVVRDGDFVAVAAPSLRQAERALFAVQAEWDEKTQPSNKELFKILRGEDTITPPSGEKQHQATYTAEYIAHVPLEPRAALAEWDGKKMTVHTGTQRPFGVRAEVAEALGIPEVQVRVIVPDTGSGYGGKHSGDAAVEAARIAKALGKPVKLVWTRQEEFTFAYFRPAGVIEVASALTADGKPSGWQFDNFNSGGAAIATPYAVPGARTRFHRADSPLRQGSYRGLAATFNNFAREGHMDELAQLSGIDPLEFRLKNLENERLRAVLQAAADRFGWGKDKRAVNHGYGIACGIDKGGYVATAAEVAVDPSTKVIRVVRAVTAFECGAILNPDHLKAQVDGSVVMGLGGALFERIEFANGRIVSDRLSRYRVPRFSDIPVMETVLLDRKDLPSMGAGECPIIAIAPAIAQGVYQATGIRLRSLPLRLS